MNSKHVSSQQRTDEARGTPLPGPGCEIQPGDVPPAKSRTYVTDHLVLTVIEHDLPILTPRDGEPQAQAESERASLGESVPLRLRTTVEALAKRRVTAMLSGAHTDPDVTFDLFLFEE